jgi:hypothetical protein
MAYKKGDIVTFKDYNIKKEDGKLIVCDIRQIPTFHKGEYVIDTNGTYTTKEGVIRQIWQDAKQIGFNWDGEAYIVDCGETYEDVGYCHTIPSDWIIKLLFRCHNAIMIFVFDTISI